MAKLVDMFEHTANGVERRWDAASSGKEASADAAAGGLAGIDRSRGAGLASRVLSAFRALVATMRRAVLLHRDSRRMMAMSDHELADIGTNRGHIEGVLREGRHAERDRPRLLPETAMWLSSETDLELLFPGPRKP